ncbi:hypothetical protein [Aureimonas phyllosphaerae]|uniref:Uncharacterized protein n=1 Tax=Aureimonas phyllosphaerae TaxID=1166078 RepID=A0A7W6BWT0_9HYPH|nr:hypothetical protein [Aureimonas phyllosphaerae]MBB3936583.1 hypothetical protein [Aureimonas phyllosphaerae]MBB3960553.1 hypothetical protein [Aureimonas phyllosphaerae]SFF24514.1 hypothetical protein SAMN05216566_105193 [Aureimonas phyllosphaerae]
MLNDPRGANAEGMSQNTMAALVFRHRRYRTAYAVADFGNDEVAGEREWLKSADTAAGDTLTTNPPLVTSAADLVAALTFIVEDEAFVCDSHKRLLERALTFLTPWSTPTLPPQPDAELMSLGVALDAAWASQDAIEETGGAGFDEAYAAALAVAGRIEALPATTLAGLQVKARVVAWCHGGEPIPTDDTVDGRTTDMRMVAALLRDLLAAV